MAKEVLDTCQNTASWPGDALMIAVESTVNPSACAQGVWGAGR